MGGSSSTYSIKVQQRREKYGTDQVDNVHSRAHMLPLVWTQSLRPFDERAMCVDCVCDRVLGKAHLVLRRFTFFNFSTIGRSGQKCASPLSASCKLTQLSNTSLLVIATQRPLSDCSLTNPVHTAHQRLHRLTWRFGALQDCLPQI